MYRRWEWSSTTLRLWRIRAGTTSWGTQVVDLRHWYDGPGDITKLRDQHNSGQYQCFSYDLLGSLTEAYTSSDATGCDSVYDNTGNGPYHYSYEYGDNGNIDYVVDETTTTTLQYTYGAGSAGPHAVTTMDGTTYTYDANGNQQWRDDDKLHWDGSNRLIEYEPDVGNSTEFVYDADGTRIVRIDPDGTSTTTIGDTYENVQGGTNDVERITYRFARATVAVRTIEGATETLDWIIADHLGSAAVARNAATGSTVRQWYRPFGSERAASGGSLPTEETYTGQVSDASTGLMFYNARYYDPNLRRFISADTIVPDASTTGEFNRYTYVINNPLRYTDPTGHDACAGGGGGCGGVRMSHDKLNGDVNGDGVICSGGYGGGCEHTFHNKNGGHPSANPAPTVERLGVSEADLLAALQAALQTVAGGAASLDDWVTYEPLIPADIQIPGQGVLSGWSSNAQPYGWRVDVSRMPAGLRQVFSEELAWKVAEKAKVAGIVLAVAFDAGDWAKGGRVAGAEGVLYEVGKTGTGTLAGIGTGALIAGTKYCKTGTWGCVAAIGIGGVVGAAAAEEAYVRLIPSPYPKGSKNAGKGG